MSQSEIQQSLEEKISGIVLDTNNVSDYEKSLDELVSSEKNQRTFDFVLSDIRKNISVLSNLPQEQKNALGDFILGLWKIDKENYQLHRDDAVYKDLVYMLFGGKEIESTGLNTLKKGYETIKSFSEELSDIYLQFIKEWKTNSSSNKSLSEWGISTFLNNKIFELKSKYPEYNDSYISMFDSHLKLPEKDIDKAMNTLFASLNTTVKQFFDQYSLEEKNYNNHVNQKNIDQSFVLKIAALEGVSNNSNEISVDYKKMRSQVMEDISKMEKSVSNLSFGKGAVLGALQKIKQSIDLASDKDLPNLIQNELKRANDLCTKYGSFVGNLGSLVDDASRNFAKINVGQVSIEQQSSIDWKLILESTDKQPDSFKKFVEEKKYEQVYNDIFDMMYLVLSNNKTLQPSQIEFRGQNIDITQNHIDNFKLLLRSQLPNKDAEVDFSKLDIAYVSKSSQGMLSHYLEGTRIVVLPYKNGEKNINGYISFGNVNNVKNVLAQGLENILQNKKIEDLFVEVTEKDGDDYLDFINKLQLDGHGGSEGLRYLFKTQPKEILTYLKGGKNLDNFLTKITTPLYKDEEKNDYIKVLIEGIGSNKELLTTYVHLAAKDGKLLGTDFITKQIITEKLFSLTQGTNPLINKESDSELLKDIISLKATIDVQKDGIDKPKTLEDQIKSVVGILFQHPIGKMLMKFLDSLFGGKGGLLKRFGKIPGFTDALNKEFEKYHLDNNQKQFLKDFEKGFAPTNDTVIENNDKEYLNHINTIAQTFKDGEDNRKNLINKFYKEEILNTELLDANLLSSYYLANKNSETLKKIPYDSLFVVDAKTQKPSIRKDVKKGGDIDTLLGLVIQDENTHKTIITADTKFKTEANLFDKDLFGISNQTDYAKALVAYLMGGSKGDGNFHYVLSENMISGPKPVDSTNKPLSEIEIKQQQEKFGNLISFEGDSDKQEKLRLLADYPKDKLDLNKDPDKKDYPKYQQLIKDFYETNFTNKEHDSYKYFSKSPLLDHKQFFVKHVIAYTSILKEQSNSLKSPEEIKTFKDKLTNFTSLVDSIDIDQNIKNQENQISKEILSQDKFKA